jgi:hypothetical protein
VVIQLQYASHDEGITWPPRHRSLRQTVQSDAIRDRPHFRAIMQEETKASHAREELRILRDEYRGVSGGQGRHVGPKTELHQVMLVMGR